MLDSESGKKKMIIMKEDKDFKTVTKILGGRKVKVSVPVRTMSKEEFEKKVTEIMKKAIARERVG